MAHKYDHGFTVGGAWHGLAEDVSTAQNSADALRLSGLDSPVETIPLFSADNIQITDFVATRCTTTKRILGVVPTTYRVLQNKQLFDFLDDVVAGGECAFDSAGSLEDGKKIFIVCKLPKVYEITPSDTILPYMTALNSHDGQWAGRIMPTSIRTVCHNTATLALNDEKKNQRGFSVKHTANLHTRLEEGKEVIRKVLAYYDTYVEQARLLANTKLNQAFLKAYFESVFPIAQQQQKTEQESKTALLAKAEQLAKSGKWDNELFQRIAHYKDLSSTKERHHKETMQSLNDIFNSETCNHPEIEGSLWAAHNAVTEYIDHRMQTRGVDPSARRLARFSSIMFGPKSVLKQISWDNALSLL